MPARSPVGEWHFEQQGSPTVERELRRLWLAFHPSMDEDQALRQTCASRGRLGFGHVQRNRLADRVRQAGFSVERQKRVLRLGGIVLPTVLTVGVKR